jgi:Chaperone of endosialidase
MVRVGSLVGVLSLFSVTFAAAQPTGPTTTASFPRVIRISGTLPTPAGAPSSPQAVTFAIYAEETGGTPLWQETQSVIVDSTGAYSALLGSTMPDGLPLEMFTTKDARWLSIHVDRPNEPDQPRVLIASVAYALRAADADTLAGRPASAYMLADPPADAPRPSDGTPSKTTAKPNDGTTTAKTNTRSMTATVGTPGHLAQFVDASNLGDSVVAQVGARIGVGTVSPADYLHIAFNDPFGAFTGLAVQNLSSTANAASGMLFFDQNGALAQFQGFTNATHEYRINNIAKNGSNQYDGSINFLVGSSSKFSIATSGNIGIGTTSPSAPLELSNALSGGTANMWVTSFTNAIGPYYLARRARGTAGAPTAVQTGDSLSGLFGQGYGATHFGPSFTGGISVQAAQNFTDTAQGTAITFSTTPINSATPATRMTLDATGSLGIGTTTTPAATLEVSNAASPFPTPAVTATSSYTGTIPLGSYFIGRKARGLAAAPSAVQNGDGLAAFVGEGYGATGFSSPRGGMFVRAAETWTDVAQGTSLAFNTTPTGTNAPTTQVTITPFGDIGVGTTNPDGRLEVVRTGDFSVVANTTYADINPGSAAFYIAQTARGTLAAPTGVLAGDLLGGLGMSGYATGSSFNDIFAAVAAVAAEDYMSNTTRGTALGFGSTPLGTHDLVIGMALLPNGNVGIGTPADASGIILTATDRLQVFGDIRVGTSGTNGCLKSFGGSALAGTCASDRRFKRDITPFGPALASVSALQPVHYFWRAAEFPERHFGDSQTYGLVAQDVEQVLPELVVTNVDGYKAVDYSKLPLLTIQAVKELKAENDALKLRIDELERLMTELLATAGRR